MSENATPEFEGRVGLIEPVITSGKSLGIKLLSVYDFLRCEVAYRNLVNKLTEQGMDRELCEKVCEKACLVSMCLYNKKGERIFSDGLSVLRGLTPEELQRIYDEYSKLNKKVINFDKISYAILDKVKRSSFKEDLTSSDFDKEMA